MEFRLLGPLEVVEDGRAVAVGGRQPRRLLALLLLHTNEVVSADRLIDELWEGRPPATAPNTMQVHVSKLRKALPGAALRTRPPGYVLEVDAERVDVRRFERLVRDGRAAAVRGDAGAGVALLDEALGLWRGPALAEFAFESFARPEITRLDELRLVAREERFDAALALGRHAELVGELEALVSENPLRERLRGQLMLALYRSGRQAEALAAYRDAREALVEGLGIDPSPQLQQLEHAILVQDPSLAPPSGTEQRAATVLFADLGVGEHADASAGAIATALEEVAAAGGAAERGIADAMLATFLDQDATQRAVAAAVRIVERLASDFGGRLRPRMAVETGEVDIDPTGRTSGRPVSIAARLVRDASPGEIVVGEQAAERLGGNLPSPRVRPA